jgi:diguanylate cyclase (GGDEF)-like protein
MVKRLLEFSYSYPKLVLLLLVVLTLAVAPALQRLQFDISAQSLMVTSDPGWEIYQKSLQDFGSDTTVIVVLSDDDLFTPQNLQRVRELQQRLQALHFVHDTSSLFSVPNIREVDGVIESRPFLDTLPEHSEQAEAILDDALKNQLVAGNLVSPDRKTMAINLSVREGDKHYAGRDAQISLAIERELEPLKQHLHTVFQMSASYVRHEISRQIEIDQESILPVALVAMLAVLALSMGRLNCAIVPLASAAVSIVLTLSFMAWMEIPVNVLTSIIPALLIIIGSTEDVHLMSEYHSGIREGLTRDEAVKRLPVNQAMAVMLAFVTTFAGFASITINEIELLHQFGWLMSFGLLLNFLVTTLFVPAYLRLFGGSAVPGMRKVNIFQATAAFMFRLVIRFKSLTLMLMLWLAGFFIWGAQFLYVNNNTLDYFSEHSDIYQRAQFIHDKLSGMQTFSIILDSSIEGTFKKVRYLDEVQQLQAFIDQRGIFDKTISFADFVKLTHQVMEGTASPQLPTEDELVQYYMEFVKFDVVSSYVTEDFSSTRILVRHNIKSSKRLKQEFDAINHFVEHDLKSRLKLTLTGESVLNDHAADAMALGQIQSLGLMILVILFLVSLLFVDFRAGLIALIPNVFPVIVLFGVMGYFQIPLDSGTTMVAVIALGIAVDDTIHFLSRYHFCTRGTDNVEKALLNTIMHEATPITTTSIALAVGFATLTLSSFEPVMYFGGLSALVMVLAMFSTFILTPVLLSFTRLITVWDMLSLNIRADVLRNSAVFQGLSNAQIKKAILSGTVRDFVRGDVIIDQGVIGHEFFVLLEGSATATHRDPDGSVHTLGYMKAGDVFGEVAQLSKRERIARVTAEERTRVLEMQWDSIRQLAFFHPRIAMRLYQNLAEVLSERFVAMQDDRGKPRDELTGALTRSYLCEIVHQHVTESHHYHDNMSLMLLELDIAPLMVRDQVRMHDEVIVAIASLIREYLRPIDVLARWGDHSFMVMFPHEDSEYAHDVARRIQLGIENREIARDVRLHINVAVTRVRESDMGRDAIDRLEERLAELQRSRKSLSVAVA